MNLPIDSQPEVPLNDANTVWGRIVDLVINNMTISDYIDFALTVSSTLPEDPLSPDGMRWHPNDEPDPLTLDLDALSEKLAAAGASIDNALHQSQNR